MEGRNPMKHKSLGGLSEFLQVSKLRPVFWRNEHGTCQVFSLFFSLLILNGQLLKDFADSDGPDGYISQSLWSFIRDSEREGQGSFLLDADDTVHLRLLLGGVYKAIEEKEKEEEEEEKEEEDGKKKKKNKNKNKKKPKKKTLQFGIQPDTVNVTIERIVQKLDDSKWKGRLYVNVGKAHTAKEICKLMESRTTMFLRTDSLPLENIEKIVDGVTGKVAFLIAVTLSSRRKDTYHAISVVYDSCVGKYLRCCNGHPRVLEKVEENRYLCESDHRTHSVKKATVCYMVTSLEEPAPKNDAFLTKSLRARTRADKTETEKAQMAGGLSGSEDEEGDEDTMDRGVHVENEKDEEEIMEESNKKEEEKKDSEVTLPNIKFVDLPNLNQFPLMKEVVIKIRSECGKRDLQWTGALCGDKYFYSDPPPDVHCPNKTTGLVFTADDNQVKEFLILHRRCHKGTEPGKRRPEFPSQKKKGPPCASKK